MELKYLIIAVLYILIFNPIIFSIIATTFIGQNMNTMSPENTTKNIPSNNTMCGLLIINVTAPTAKSAGLTIGEIITTANNYPVFDMNALTHALSDKRANDTVTVITNKNSYNVPLFANPQDPNQILLGIKVKPTECNK
jgi:hypothetical protein